MTLLTLSTGIVFVVVAVVCWFYVFARDTKEDEKPAIFLIATCFTILALVWAIMYGSFHLEALDAHEYKLVQTYRLEQEQKQITKKLEELNAKP